MVVSNGQFGFHINDELATHSFDSYGTNLSDGNWHHVTLQIRGSAGLADVFIDNVATASDIDISAVTGDITNNEALLIGGHTSDYASSGLLDDVQFFNSTLTTTEVSELFTHSCSYADYRNDSLRPLETR